MTQLKDYEARDRIERDLETTLIVEAAAGTGKTTALVGRVLSLLRTGTARLSRLVAVTFTEKAAGEMKLRLRTEIERSRERATKEEKKRLDAALEELEAAHIGTIHAFCAEILRERPVQARVDPLFAPADEAAQGAIFDEAFQSWFEEQLRNPDDGVRRTLRKKATWMDGGPRSLLRTAGLRVADQRDYDHPWRRDPTFDRRRELDSLLLVLRDLGKLADVARDSEWSICLILKEVRRVVGEIDRREQMGRPRDHDAIEEELRGLARGKSNKLWDYHHGQTDFGGGYKKGDVMAKREAAKAQLDATMERADADLAASLFSDLRPLIRGYEDLKDRAGRLDFLDLLIKTRDLLRDDATVRRDLQERFSHVLVDEFQDTDPLQAEILLLITADDSRENDFKKTRPIPGKLFVVGDPKQSIYRFRRAEVMLYESTKRRLMEHGATLLYLTTSFRAAPSLQTAVNAAFEGVMTGNEEGSQAAYVSLTPPPDREEPPHPTLIALPVPRPYSKWTRKPRVTNAAINESIPDAVGAFVDWLLHSDWTVEERGQRVPVSARHICLLTRRLVSFGEDITRPYVRALEARRIPHVLVGGRSFFQREEVIALRNALSAVEWPDDELSVFATLHGPFFALADDVLLAYRHANRTLNPMRTPATIPEDSPLAPVAAALGILRDLHVWRNRRPLGDTIARLLDETRAHAGVAIWLTGEQALANLLRLLDTARRFEQGGTTSFRAFIRHLEELDGQGGGAEAPVVEEGTDGVRIMTVRKAKGLEFPVVIFIDPATEIAQKRPSRWIDPEKRLWAMPLAGCIPLELLEHRETMLRHDLEEGVRLAYVAATRAKELLVVPVVGDQMIDGWASPLDRAVYPNSREWRARRDAPHCPVFQGTDSVYERPARLDDDERTSVMPGLHGGQVGTHSVVWWDPRALRLDVEEDVGQRQQTILSEAEETNVEGERAHADWQTRRAEAIASGAVPRFKVAIVTAKREEASGALAAVEHTDVKREGRPRGKRFGILVHAVLAAIELDAKEAAVRVAAQTQARIVGATDDEITHAARAVTAALAHPLLKRAAAGEHRREASVSLTVDGAIIEGVLDLAFRDESGWTVVDFKTDAELDAERVAIYSEQVFLYARAIETATGLPTKAVLLSV